MAVATMAPKSWPYFDPEYETLGMRINPHGIAAETKALVVIDNDSYEDATLVKVNSANKHGILLEVVQVLTDLELTISKAYIASDGGWFMDVFHVTDLKGCKIRDQATINHIQETLAIKRKASLDLVRCPGRSVGVKSIAEHTAIELTGTDRPGLLSEVSAVLTSLKCTVNAAEVWTHNMRVACVVYVTDEDTAGPIADKKKQDRIEDLLYKVMKGDDDRKVARTVFAEGFTHTERRLHQMMAADKDYEQSERPGTLDGRNRTEITVQNCESGYSVITVQCADRPKLVFDTVCTLTDMQYVVFHASIDSSGPTALQEYHVRQLDGCTLDEESEERVKKCLRAALERRSSEGLRLELCTSDRVGLLSDVTRVFRENGLSVTRADVATRGDKAVNVFYVTDAAGNPVDMKIVQAMQRDMGQMILEVKEGAPNVVSQEDMQGKFSLGSFLKSYERFFTGLAGWRTTAVA